MEDMEWEPKITLAHLCEAMAQDRFYSIPGVALRLSRQFSENLKIEEATLTVLMGHCKFPHYLKDATADNWIWLFALLIFTTSMRALAQNETSMPIKDYPVDLSQVHDIFYEIKFPAPAALFEDDKSNTEHFIQAIPQKQYVHFDLTVNKIQKLVEKLNAVPASSTTAQVLTDAQPCESASQPKTKAKRKHTRGAITQKQAAARCQVSLRLFQNWEAGQNVPDGFPGRSDAMALAAWANSYAKQQELRRIAMNISRATPMDPNDIEKLERKRSIWEEVHDPED